MYALDAALSLTLLYPLAHWGERYLRLETRVLVGVLTMAISMGAMVWVNNIHAAFVVLSIFFIGSLIAEPAREALLARFAQPQARASYMGMGRIGLAIGGLFGYTGGGMLLDHARALNLPALPWLVLAAVGLVTWLALYRQFFPTGNPGATGLRAVPNAAV